MTNQNDTKHVGISMIEPWFMGEEKISMAGFMVHYHGFSQKELHGRISEINIERFHATPDVWNYLVKIFFCHEKTGVDVDFPYEVQFDKLEDAQELANAYLGLFMSGETMVSYMIDAEGNRVDLESEPF